MKILGLSYMYHDSAAALLVDGEVVAAAAEERFNRRKHSIEFPARAIRYCLDEAKISVGDLDWVAFYEKPILKFERFLTAHLAYFPRSFGAFRHWIALFLTKKLQIPSTIQARTGYEGRVLFIEHHPVHAASAFFASPFEEAAILTVDGTGEWCTTAVGTGRGHRIELTHEIRWPHSIGLLYSAVTAFLGFRVNSGEGKVMGLAPYGDPDRYLGEFRKIIRTAPDGSFQLDLSYFRFQYKQQMVSRKFEETFGPPRIPEGPIDDRHRDVAAALQRRVEEVLLQIARDLHRRTGARALCIAGGVGLNSVANGRILREGPFDEIFVQPASGDDGGALGAALYTYHQIFDRPRRWRMRHAYLGPAFTEAEIRGALEAAGVAFERLTPDDLVERVAGELEVGRIVGWFQGRMEYGPRALGARSILANPMIPGIQDRLNARVKHREAFRPFAPAVVAERARDFFDLDAPSPYMLLVAPVRPEWRSRLPGITHVDGSARVQTVEAEVAPLFHRLIEAFGRRTGVPVILNTSFNLRGEPIVCTPADAIDCYSRTEMDLLVLGPFVVTRDRPGQDGGRD